MSRSPEEFARLLTEGVHRIRLRESKSIQVIQDELGQMLHREGGSAIEYWRKGHIPPRLSEIEALARVIVKRGNLKRLWLEKFLHSAAHPYPAKLCDELFPDFVVEETRAAQQKIKRSKYHQRAGLPNTSSTMVDNPFIIGPPILHPRHFFGRNHEIKRIFGVWQRPPLQNVAVIGLKLSGKTSLLHYLKNITTTPATELRPGQRTDWLPQPENYRWLFVDFRDTRMCQRERLLRYLLTNLDMPIPEPCDLENFMDTVSHHLHTPTILLMDEINVALEAPELDMQFWGSLRSLGSNLTGGNLAFLLTAHEAPALLAQQKGKPSPFFNIFGHTFSLGPLAEEEARELIAASPIPFTSEDIEWILAQSECWPCRLQALAHARLAALQYGETDNAWKNEGLRQMPPY